MLNSLVEEGVLDRSYYQIFMKSIFTVTSGFSRDIKLIKRKKLNKGDFLKRYGHLRPGTYDITIPRYDDISSNYFEINNDSEQEAETITTNFELSPRITPEVKNIEKQFGYYLMASSLIMFSCTKPPLQKKIKVSLFTKIPNPMTIIFIRHSKTNVDPKVAILDWKLSDEGVELAKQLSTHAIIKSLEVLYSSFQFKAVETAMLLATPHSILIKKHDHLKEITSFTGTFEVDTEQYKRRVKDYYVGKLDRINGGETQKEAVARFTKAIKDIVYVEQGKKYIGIVSHGHIFTLYASQFKNIDCYAMHSIIKQPDIAVFDWEKQAFVYFFGELI